MEWGWRNRKIWQMTALNVWGLLHPSRVVLNPRPHLRPTAYYLSALCPP